MSLVDLPEKFNEIKISAAAIEFTDIQLTEKFREAFEKYIAKNTSNGYSGVEWAGYSAKILTSTGRSIYLPNHWFYLASELSGLLGGLIEQKKLFEVIFKGQDLNLIAKDLRDNSGEENKRLIKSYFNSNGYSHKDYDNFEKYVSDYSSWGGGKTIDRGDFFISPLMKAGNLLAETQGAVAEIAECFYKSRILLDAFSPTFMSPNLLSSPIEDSANVVLIQDDSIGKFIYELLDFLLKSEKETPLFDCLVEKSAEHGSYNIEYKTQRLTSFFKVSDIVLNDSDLIFGDKVRFFSSPFELNSKFYYLSNQWTDGTESRLDIQSLISIFNAIYDEYKIVGERGGYILEEVKRVSLVCLPKPFLLLAGISGTGKTRFVREQARATDSTLSNYCLVPVRPDWHEPSDLLGYVSRLGGKAEYVPTQVLNFIINAWRAIATKANAHEMGKLDISSPPYWLCLDEMNLAPVEQYFADYLSVLESRSFKNGEYKCEPLLDKTVLSMGEDVDFKKDLGLENDSDLWAYFLKNGIAIPPNLIVAGTVNMDETTHGFSRKVIDRALTIDFGEFFPNDYDTFFGKQHQPKIFTYNLTTQATKDDLSCCCDDDGEKTITFLKAVNGVLKTTPFELAYRALNELLLMVSCSMPKDDKQLQAVWDDFLMTKILPRIDGDEDKLMLHIEDQPSATVLAALVDVLKMQLDQIWEEGETREDLHRLTDDGNAIYDIECRSRHKIQWMIRRLEVNTFTSFWP